MFSDGLETRVLGGNIAQDKSLKYSDGVSEKRQRLPCRRDKQISAARLIHAVFAQTSQREQTLDPDDLAPVVTPPPPPPPAPLSPPNRPHVAAALYKNRA